MNKNLNKNKMIDLVLINAAMGGTLSLEEMKLLGQVLKNNG